MTIAGLFLDESLTSLMDHLRINASTDIGSMIVNEAGQGHVDKLKELLMVHPDKVGIVRPLYTAALCQLTEGET